MRKSLVILALSLSTAPAYAQIGPGGPVSAGESWQVADTPPVTTGNYASGNCMGGWRQITIALFPGQTGFMTNFRVVSVAGQGATVVAYFMDSSPVGSVCSDKTQFTLVAADIDKQISQPQTITLVSPTGSTPSQGSADFTPPRPFVSGGSFSSGVKTIWYALVATGSWNVTSATDVHTRTGVLINN